MSCFCSGFMGSDSGGGGGGGGLSDIVDDTTPQLGGMLDVNGNALAMPDGSVLVSGIPGLTFAGYQGMFAVITPALMTGAFADRLRFAPYLVFVALWIVLVYAPWCHWIWGPGGWIGAWGVKDFAGGIVVHTTAGFSALAACQFLGPRAKVRIPARQTHVSSQALRPSGPQTLRP